jgi:MYXO-CTERM domain-containing protein
LRRTCDAAGSDCAPTCQYDVECITGAFCDETDGNCRGDLPVGAACTRPDQCQSTFCADGFCCNQACNQVCEACDVPDTSGKAGSCTTVVTDEAPHHGICQAAHPDCGAGKCDGSSRVECAFAASVCGAKTCSATTLTQGLCTTKGQCTAGASVSDCGLYQCATATSCRDTCSSHGHCAFGYRCDFTTSTCTDKLLLGDPCSAAEECDSDQCMDGVCCNTACGDQCTACNETGNEGTCVPVSGAPRGSRNACDPGDHVACAAHCDGLFPTCQYPDQGTPCEVATCSSESVLDLARVCDGAGSCTLNETQDCGAFRCDDALGACKVTCESDADCTAGAACDTSQNVCAFTDSICKDLFTSQHSDGSLESCAPFICDSGACLKACQGDAECAAGYACNAQNCVEDTGAGGASSDAGVLSGSSDSGGCGCRTAGGSGSSRTHALLMLVGSLLFARGRRRAGRCFRQQSASQSQIR